MQAKGLFGNWVVPRGPSPEQSVKSTGTVGSWEKARALRTAPCALRSPAPCFIASTYPTTYLLIVSFLVAFAASQRLVQLSLSWKKMVQEQSCQIVNITMRVWTTRLRYQLQKPHHVPTYQYTAPCVQCLVQGMLERCGSITWSTIHSPSPQVLKLLKPIDYPSSLLTSCWRCL